MVYGHPCLPARTCPLADLGVASSDGASASAPACRLDRKPLRGDRGSIAPPSTNEQAKRVADLHAIAYTLAGAAQRRRLAARSAHAVIAGRQIAATVAWCSAGRQACRLAVVRARRPVCLTGNAQMALVWMEVLRKRATPLGSRPPTRPRCGQAGAMLDSEPDLRGAVPGRAPVGEYNAGRS
jgi:hypothetical protein